MAQDSKTRYYRVSPKVWRHAKKAGWGDRETLLALYLLTCPHRNMAGLYYLPREYMQADLGWDAGSLRGALDALWRDDFVRYDDDAQVVLILNALAYDAPDNPNQIKAAMKQLEELPETPLLTALADRAAETCEPLSAAICNRWPNCLRNGLTNGSGEPLVEQLTEPPPQPSGEPVSVSVSATTAVAVTTAVAEGETRAPAREESPPSDGADDPGEPDGTEDEAPARGRKPKDPPPQEAVFLASWLSHLIARSDPQAVVTEGQRGKWAAQFDVQHRRDGVSWEDMRNRLDFAHGHHFLRTVVLSADALRRHWNRIGVEMQTNGHPRAAPPRGGGMSAEELFRYADQLERDEQGSAAH